MPTAAEKEKTNHRMAKKHKSRSPEDGKAAVNALLYVEDANLHAIRLYERFGFRDVDRPLVAYAIT